MGDMHRLLYDVHHITSLYQDHLDYSDAPWNMENCQSVLSRLPKTGNTLDIQYGISSNLAPVRAIKAEQQAHFRGLPAGTRQVRQLIVQQ